MTLIAKNKKGFQLCWLLVSIFSPSSITGLVKRPRDGWRSVQARFSFSGAFNFCTEGKDVILV